ncbi:alginate O-acetyltransferase AlgX-related protein [Falsiroseomonas tokyonensis]|uniref:Cell division protein FtsQ n=1 Tax=Falsiroseomonas tokyonensis TaxID=430521 RepID=A0ABV7BR57_9PROT|nr:cell division protein FtsQ [Falsiroseomonas tokyonensis]MBU8536536.1 cell division protein FtsQ [Falsiroseomonas tokyonensis]
MSQAEVPNPRRRLAEAGLGAAMAVVLGLGLWQGVAAMATPQAARRLAPTLNTESFLAGRTAAAVNQVMAQDLPVDGLLRAAGGVLRWKIFGSGGPTVAPGCGDWLFLTEELRPWGPEGQAAMARRAELLARVAKLLAARDIALQVVLVPDKARAAAAMRCGIPYSAESEARGAAFRQMLQGQLPLLDLAPVLAPEGPALFYRTDTHWNQDGARRAAEAIAAALPAGIARDTAFRTSRAAEETPLVGDLLRLMSLDQVPDALRPRPDRQFVETTEPAEAEEASILDEAPVPEVVLIGSSFSRNANFDGALQQALSAPVGNLSRAGGGFAGAARDFFGSPAWRETPPRLLVWEIPERVLNQPLNADDAALLAWLDGQPE